MPTSIIPRQQLLALLLGASLLTACGGDDSAALVADAKAKLAAGDYKAAMIQLKNAVAEDDKNADARFELGKLYFSQLELASAEKEFRRAREAGFPAGIVNPMIARALLGQREYQRVLDELPAPADNAPDSVTLMALRASAALGLGQTEAARKTLQLASLSASDNIDVLLALAQLALADRDASLAMQHLERALKIDPRHTESLTLKADLLRLTGKPDEAARIYREAIKIDPRQINARLALANISIAGNRLDEARAEVDAVLKIMPNSLQAHHAQALISFQENKTERARDQLASVLKSAPEFLPALMLGGAIEFRLGNLQMAETYLNKVVKTAPDNLNAQRLLAATQLRLGRSDDAERTLAPALRSPTPDAGVLMVAGEIALARKDFSRAAELFEQAARLSPNSAAIRTELGFSRLAQGDDRAMDDLKTASGMEGAGDRADTLIILKQLQGKQFDAALASIAALEKKQTATPLTWNYRAAAYLGKQDIQRARDSFSQALKLDPTFFPAAANLAQLDLKAKQPAAARQRFERLLKADPRHLNAMLALADLSLLGKDEKAYAGWLEKAAATHPQAMQPRIALARHQLAKGDKNKALATAREAVNAQPDAPAALELLGTTQLAVGDHTNALVSYRKLADRLPKQPAPLVKVATAQIAAKDLTGARSTLQDALRLQPDFADAQLILAGIEIQSARFDEAYKLARQVQQQKPDNPAGFILEGDAAFARKDYPAALAAFERAQKLSPAGALLVRQMQAFSAAQRHEEGEKRLASWLSSHPQDANIRAVLAESLIKRGQFAAAAEHYLVLDRSNPGNLLILNNLAWALHEAGDKRALRFAEQAVKSHPDDPSALDTYGWILSNAGQSAKGLEHLRKAVSKAPNNAEIQYHLAAALFKAGERTRARGELERLLASGIHFPDEAKARALLKQIDSTR